MLRNLKVFGLSLVAMLAIGAVGVSGAEATVQLHSEGAPTTLTGREDTPNGLDVGYGSFSCVFTNYTGTVSAKTTSTFSLSPEYINCSLAGFAATFAPNGCSYLFHVNSIAKLGTVDIVCPEGKKITIAAPSIGTVKCTVTIGPQTGSETFQYTNIGTGATQEVTVDIGEMIGSISYTQTAGTGLGKCSTTSASNGRFTGTLTLTGETDGGGTHTGIWVE